MKIIPFAQPLPNWPDGKVIIVSLEKKNGKNPYFQWSLIPKRKRLERAFFGEVLWLRYPKRDPTRITSLNLKNKIKRVESQKKWKEEVIFYTGRTSLGFWSGGLIQRSAARTVDLVIEWESNSDGMGAGAAARSKRNEPCRFGLTAAAANPIDALPPQNGSSNLLFFILLLLLLPFFSFFTSIVSNLLGFFLCSRALWWGVNPTTLPRESAGFLFASRESFRVSVRKKKKSLKLVPTRPFF